MQGEELLRSLVLRAWGLCVTASDAGAHTKDIAVLQAAAIADVLPIEHTSSSGRVECAPPPLSFSHRPGLYDKGGKLMLKNLTLPELEEWCVSVGEGGAKQQPPPCTPAKCTVAQEWRESMCARLRAHMLVPAHHPLRPPCMRVWVGWRRLDSLACVPVGFCRRACAARKAAVQVAVWPSHPQPARGG